MTTVFLSHPTDKLEPYYGPRATAALRAIAEVRFNPEPRDLTPAELLEAAQGCEAIVAYRQTPAPEALFAGLPELAAFLRCAVDIRTVDVAAASRHGVLVTQATPGYVPAVAEWVIGAMIDLGRGLSRYVGQYQRGETVQPRLGRELRGATLGIVGHGQIGRYLGEAAQALGMRLLVNTPEPVPERPGLQQLGFEALLAASDYVVCLAPALPETENLFDAQAFAAMKPGACFLNAARGELVDEHALLQALDRGHLAGCALDVGRAPDQMPSPALARHPRVIAAPHIGGLTVPATEHQALETVAQLQALLRGEVPAGAVNLAQATRLRRWGVPLA